MLSRRRFLTNTGLTLAATAVANPLRAAEENQKKSSQAPQVWAAVRREFNLNPEFIHLGLFFLTSHPRAVRDAIERYRRELDSNPVLTVEHALFEPEFGKVPRRVKSAIATYIGGSADDIALTGSTTEGLAVVYHGLQLKPGDDILTTTHDHFVHHEAIRTSTERSGASFRKISLWDSYATIDPDDIAQRIRAAVRPNTRAVGITWVHSSSGVKLPIRRIADALAPLNASRDPRDRVLLIVDGVHGLGVEDPRIAASGADFFSAGTHKWIFGPRGTGFVWGRPEAWARLRPIVPTFEAMEPIAAWFEERTPSGPPRASWFSPGGFHAFEHYWAVPAALDFHQNIGPARVTQRIHSLNAQMKEGLARMSHVTLYTPRAASLSAGIVCFDVKGLQPPQVVRRLLQKKIIATTSPYRISYARVAAGLPNSPEEVDKTLAAIRALAAA